MKKVNLLLLLLCAAYSTATFATKSGSNSFGGTGDWSKTNWDKPDWNKLIPNKPDWDKLVSNKPDWNKIVWDKSDWSKSDWDEKYVSCKPKYDDDSGDVPEPGIVGLLAIGLVGLVAARRRMKI